LREAFHKRNLHDLPVTTDSTFWSFGHFCSLTEKAHLLKNMFGMSSRTGSQDEGVGVSEIRPRTASVMSQPDSSRGYAFSQEEGGVVSQSTLIRQYNTKDTKPAGT